MTGGPLKTTAAQIFSPRKSSGTGTAATAQLGVGEVRRIALEGVWWALHTSERSVRVDAMTISGPGQDALLADDRIRHLRGGSRMRGPATSESA